MKSSGNNKADIIIEIEKILKNFSKLENKEKQANVIILKSLENIKIGDEVSQIKARFNELKIFAKKVKNI